MKRKRKLLPPQKRAKVTETSLPELPQLSESGTVLRREDTDRFQRLRKQKQTEPRERFVVVTGYSLSKRVRAYCHDPNINISYTDFFNSAAEAYLKSHGA